MEKIILVEKNNVPVSLGFGKFSFPIENDILCDSLEQKYGELYYKGNTEGYDLAWETCNWAWKNKFWDEKESNL
jgi:hypothetical protein